MIVGFENYRSKYNFKVTGIIHVGAHFGQEYEGYKQEFGEVETHWFEPVDDMFKKLSENLFDKPKVHLYNYALGEKPNKLNMYIDTGNDGQSSSILKPKQHIEQFPHIEFKESSIKEVKVERLDYFNIEDCNMLVLDTQGYELNVLKGSPETLKKINYLFTEFNTIEMYENCPSLESIDEFLKPFGFERMETWYTDSNWGDALYVKSENPKLKLSVIIPAYRFKNYLSQCIESILSQKTNFLFEILIRDDFSNDGSVELIEYIILNNNNPFVKIRHFKPTENWGGFKNIQFLLDNSKGDYIAYLDGDDYFTDEYKLQKQVDFLENNPEYVMHSTGCFRVDKNGNDDIGDWKFLVPLQEEVTLQDIFEKNTISFGRTFRNILNLLDDDFSDLPFVDWILNYKLLLYGKAKCDNYPSGAYRNTTVGEITKLSQEEVFLINEKIKSKILNHYHQYKQINKNFSQNNEQDIILDFFSNKDPNQLRFLDIGANDGISFSNTHALSLIGWSGFCIEPSNLAFEKLSNLYSSNSKIKCFNVGISDTSGKKTFYESRDWVDSAAPVSVLSSLHKENKDRFYGMNWEETESEFLTFTDFVNRYEIEEDTFDFISIDCEGHDYVVLQQIKDFLYKTQLVCIEYVDDLDISKYSNFFSEYGFEFHTKTTDNIFFKKEPNDRFEKYIAIVDCFVHSEKVENKLIECIERLVEDKIPILLISNTLVKSEILEKVDFYLYDKRNQLFSEKYSGVRDIDLWKTNDTFEAHEIKSGLQRHGLSVLINLFSSLNFAKSQGYSHFFRFEVDDEFGSQSREFIKSVPSLVSSLNKKSLFYFNENSYEPNNISFHFMYSEIDFFLNSVPTITKESDYVKYLLNKKGNLDFEIAEEYIYNNIVKSDIGQILRKDGSKDMEIDFPDTIWNTIVSESNTSEKFKGATSLIYKVKKLETSDFTDKITILSFNYKDFEIKRDIEVVLANGSIEKITHILPNYGAWSYHIYGNNVSKIKVYEDDKFLYEDITNESKNYIAFK